jgi:hypothetical protein
MATSSQLPSAPGQPQHQGLGTPFGETATHPGSTTLDEVHNLLQNLGAAISALTARVIKNEEVTKDVRTTVKNISQAVNDISGKINKPRTPPQTNPVQPIDKTPRPGTSAGKKVKLEPPANVEWHHITSNNESEAKVVTTATNPVTSRSKIRTASILIGPSSQSLSCTPGGLLKPIKVKAPDPFKGGSGTEAKQWAARMSGWIQLSATQLETKEDIITFLLVNMEGSALAWALPHLANIGTEKATITTIDKFDTAFKRAFFDPDKQHAAERKITTLVQTTTTATYATDFQTLLMSLDWNDAALHAQFYMGLH